MKNSLKDNGSSLTIFSSFEDCSVHVANIDLKVNRVYFNGGSEELLNGVTQGRNKLVFDEEKYHGKFNSGFEFKPFELSHILATILA